MADVAKTCPFDPTLSTMTEAMTTIKSGQQEEINICDHSIYGTEQYYQEYIILIRNMGQNY